MILPKLLALIIVIVLPPFFGHSGEASAVAVHGTECETDYDCNSGQFCFQSGRVSYCSACVDCQQRYKRDSTRCARSRTDCGKCLPGFLEQGAHCSARVREHVMGYQDEQNSKFHHGSHEKLHVLWLVFGLSVLIVTVVVVLPNQHGAGAVGAREEANSHNLLARQGPQFDPSVTVPHDPLWDSTAPSLPESDPTDANPGPSKSPLHANPSERDDDEHVVPVKGNLATNEAGKDCLEGIDLALSPPASPSDPLSSFIWDVLQQGPEQSQTGGPDEMESELLPEKSMDFSAIMLDAEEEDLMQIDANEGEGAAVQDAGNPEEHPPAIFQQFQGAVDEESFYHPH